MKLIVTIAFVSIAASLAQAAPRDPRVVESVRAQQALGGQILVRVPRRPVVEVTRDRAPSQNPLSRPFSKGPPSWK